MSGIFRTARQHGKSVMQTQAISAIFDEWDIIDNSKAEKPVEYLEFDDDPLALVCASVRNGKQPVEIVELLGLHVFRETLVPINIKNLIDQQDRDRANEIYDYFNKKHTLRRIKGEWISEYMRTIEDLCNVRQKVNQEHVKILVTLPRIYEQNKQLERIMKGHNSSKATSNLSFAAMHTDLEFVDKVKLRVNGNKEIHYFWSTPKNYLVRFVLQDNGYSELAWDVISDHGKIHINTETIYTYPIKGYAFNVLQTSTEQTEIKLL